MKSKRIQWLDFAKGFTIFSVLLAHSMQYANVNSKLLVAIKDMVFIFIMPCFFAISGYLYKRTDTIHKYLVLIYKKVTSFVIPYVIFSVSFLWLSYYLNNWKNIPGYQNPFNLLIHPYGYMWFLFALFFIFLIVGVLDLCHLNLWYQGIICLILFGYQAMRSYQVLMPGGNVTHLAGIGGYMIFFFMGELIKRYSLFFKNRVFNIKSLIPLGVAWIISMWLYFYVNGIAYDTDAVDIVTYGDFLPKLISLFLFLNLFINFKHDRLFKYFDKYGKQTLIIYLVHFLVLNYVATKWFTKFAWSFCGAGIVKILILILIGWYASVFVCWLSDKSRVVNFLFYPRKYVNKIVGKAV